MVSHTFFSGDSRPGEAILRKSLGELGKKECSQISGFFLWARKKNEQINKVLWGNMVPHMEMVRYGGGYVPRRILAWGDMAHH